MFTEESMTTLMEDCGFEAIGLWRYGLDMKMLIDLVEQPMVKQSLCILASDFQEVIDKRGYNDLNLWVFRRKRK